MKARKLSAVLIVLLLTFALVITGCGSKNSGNDEKSETKAEASTSADVQAGIYEELAGEYQDETSQRATAVLIADPETGCAHITVVWGSAANEELRWEMTAEKSDNRLVYSDCRCTQTDYDEGGKDGVEKVIYEDGEGSFVIDDSGRLLWTGAADEDCKDCVFVLSED